jgi:hypothetical protein
MAVENHAISNFPQAQHNRIQNSMLFISNPKLAVSNVYIKEISNY